MSQKTDSTNKTHKFLFKSFQKFLLNFRLQRCWWQNQNIFAVTGDYFCYIGDFWRIKSINNISDQSPTSQSCHQHPHFVFEICHQHRCSLKFTVVSSNSISYYKSMKFIAEIVRDSQSLWELYKPFGLNPPAYVVIMNFVVYICWTTLNFVYLSWR